MEIFCVKPISHFNHDWGTPDASRNLSICNFTFSSVGKDLFLTPCFQDAKRSIPGMTIGSCYESSRAYAIEGFVRSIMGHKTTTRNTTKRGGSPMLNNTLEQSIFDFLHDTVIEKVWNKLGHKLEGIRVFYDSLNELNDNGDQHIVIIYELVEYKIHLFFLEVALIVRALRATVQKDASPLDKQCLNALLDIGKNGFDGGATVISMAA